MAKAKEKPKHHRSKGMTIPLAVVAGMMPTAAYAMACYKNGGLGAAGDGLIESFTGYSPAVRQWHGERFMAGTGMMVLGVLVHKIVGGQLGINRALSRAGVPFLRV